MLALLFTTSGADSRLSDAAMKGDHVLFQSLLKQKVDVNVAQGDGSTALHWAAYRDDLEMAKSLIQAGANAKAQTRLGDVTPLHLAATNGSAAMLELLLKAGAEVNRPNGNGTTALMLAAASGKIDAIRTLLDFGANIDARDTAHGQTALMFAASRNSGAAIKLLAVRGANLKIASDVTEVKLFNDKPSTVPADARVHNGNPLTSSEPDKPANAVPVKPPTDERARNVTMVGGNTALHFAARDGQMEAVAALVAAGADVNQVSATDAMSPLIQAIITGHFDIAKYLLQHGADPNLATKKEGLTPLWATLDSRYAARIQYPAPSVEQEKTTHLELIQELLKTGAKPNARLTSKPWFRTLGNSFGLDPAGSTAFWRAAQANDLEAMKILLAAGANPNIATTHGCSPLQVAAGMMQDFQAANFVPEARMETVRYLVETLGADVNSRDDKAYSVLHGAAFIGRNDVVAYLIAHGADVTARANQISNGASAQAAKPGQGDTVADMANGWTEKVLQFPDTVNLLIKMGSGFSNTCFASVCVNPTRSDKPLKVPQQ